MLSSGTGEVFQDLPGKKKIANFRTIARAIYTDENTPNRPITDVYAHESRDTMSAQVVSSALADADLSAAVRAHRAGLRRDRRLSALRRRALRDDAALAAYADALAGKVGAQ